MNTNPLNANWYSENTHTTQSIGRLIASHLHGGMVIGLSGPLGSGKTTLISGILAGFDLELIASPTFQLICEYYSKHIYIYHIDCYRLKHIDELEHIAWRDLTGENSILLIEWYDRFPELSLEHSINISMDERGNRHIIARDHGKL